jgi:hypothetical protein
MTVTALSGLGDDGSPHVMTALSPTNEVVEVPFVVPGPGMSPG